MYIGLTTVYDSIYSMDCYSVTAGVSAFVRCPSYGELYAGYSVESNSYHDEEFNLIVGSFDG